MNIDNQTSPFQQRKALSVSDLNRQVKKLLEASYHQIWVEGEISSFSRPSSGHWYFSLKDDKSQLRCAMFKGFNQRLKFIPKEGDKLLVKGKLSLYEGRGDYQLIADAMEPAGLGQLQAAFEALKLKLSQEGLFDASRKKALPRLPKKIAVITSETGAVIHDIVEVCAKRFPAIPIVLIPVQVQGHSAANEIASAISVANELKLADVIIVGRGGGSIEDLWSFNEEIVARAIAASELPIVSAVGHEVDVTIADWVADYRAPTPSAAAEALTPDSQEMMQRVDGLERRLVFMHDQHLSQRKKTLRDLSRRLKTPSQALQQSKERTHLLFKRLSSQCSFIIQGHANRLANANIARYNPHQQVELAHAKVERLFQRAEVQHQSLTQNLQHRLALSAEKLNLASPLATLSRGYAIALDDQNQVIRSPEDTRSGDSIKIKVQHGEIDCTVK